MDLGQLARKSDVEWWIEPHGAMRVPGIIYGATNVITGGFARRYRRHRWWYRPPSHYLAAPVSPAR